jgi:hypothetical protein
LARSSSSVSFAFGGLPLMSKMISKRWVWVATIFALLWVSAEVRYWRLRHRLSGLWVAAPYVKVVDSSSGTVLPVTIGGIPGLSAEHDYLPWVAVTSLPDGDAERSRITVVSDRPLTLQISSDGYEAQPLTINRSSLGEVVVKLRKK